jgi:hypothetical protein
MQALVLTAIHGGWDSPAKLQQILVAVNSLRVIESVVAAEFVRDKDWKLASHISSPLCRVLMGSVSTYAVANAGCPVTVVKAP